MTASVSAIPALGRHSECRSPSGRVQLPLRAAILVGGMSTRMGRPKAALEIEGRHLLDRAIDVVAHFAGEVAIVGRMPPGLEVTPRIGAAPRRTAWLADDPATLGPLAGIVAALASAPSVDWLCVPCDMPAMSVDAIGWLLGCHRRSNSATVGIRGGSDRIEPFPVIFGPSALVGIRGFVATGNRSLHGALRAIDACFASIPSRFTRCWQNVNSPDDWDDFLLNRCSTA